MVVALVWAQQLADGVPPALQLGPVRAVRPALTRARAALAQATAVRWVVPAVARCDAVAPAHATRPWVLPGFVVAVAVVLAQQLADEVQAALRQGPVPAERLVALRRAWAALTVVAAPASPVPVEQLAARRTLARPCVAVAQAVRRVVRAVGRFHADPPYRAVPEAALPAPLVGSAAGRPGAAAPLVVLLAAPVAQQELPAPGAPFVHPVFRVHHPAWRQTPAPEEVPSAALLEPA